ncbi:hypothetical protein [Streptomyces paromomycinus]|uniref:Uncharacterized protein n=1 Tax=Streptomyces paromomycinus TaxID=92743 RepID=A0A401VYU8_STREY|nr:hypothetical protein [Streptomyces paromomycinus]GCD42254.1 hypothetical protein GKJPGBOP_01913 [Streptomyces paromomycinus]
MSTPAPSATPAPAAASGDLPQHDPFAPSTTALRVFAGLGLPLLAVAYVLFMVVVLHQAYSGDGASGPLVYAAQTSLALSPVAGLIALGVPASAMGHAARRNTVGLQYGLMIAGPLLAAVDFH